MLDLRHTLPNLKNLLLTLASPDPPSPGPVAGPGWASGAASRASSRHPSTHWTLPKAALAVSSASLASSPSHTPSLTSASIRSVCPTDTQASAPPTPVLSPPPHGTATSPVPWRARVEKPSQLGPLRTPGRNQRASAGTLGLGLAPPAAPAPGGTEVAEKEDDL
jgi:hypothetical protein